MKGIKENGNKRKRILLTIFVILFVFISIGFIQFYKQSTVKNDSNNKIQYSDYIYKIRYDFGAETYIYLFENRVIKTLTITPLTELCSEKNCMYFTGEYGYEEKEIQFSPELKDKVIKTLDALYEISGKKEFDADKMELTEYQKRVLLAILLNDEDIIIQEKDTDASLFKNENK